MKPYLRVGAADIISEDAMNRNETCLTLNDILKDWVAAGCTHVSVVGVARWWGLGKGDLPPPFNQASVDGRENQNIQAKNWLILLFF